VRFAIGKRYKFLRRTIMKEKLVLMGMLALALTFGMAAVGCGGGNDDGGGGRIRVGRPPRVRGG
jgi:hypothetical protein